MRTEQDIRREYQEVSPEETGGGTAVCPGGEISRLGAVHLCEEARGDSPPEKESDRGGVEEAEKGMDMQAQARKGQGQESGRYTTERRI